MNWNEMADQACNGEEIARKDAFSVLRCPDDDLLALVDAAYKVRRKFFDKRVKLNFLLNAKSGLCPEDCFYCSQSKISKAAIDKYPFLSQDEILQAAGRAVSGNPPTTSFRDRGSRVVLSDRAAAVPVGPSHGRCRCGVVSGSGDLPGHCRTIHSF